MKRYIVTLLSAVLACGISAEVQKNMVIVGKDGSRTEFNRENIKEVVFKESPEYTEANTLLGASYKTNNGKAIYQIDIATGMPDDNGDPAETGDFQVALALTGDLSADASAAAIPAGYYRASTSSDLFTFDVQNSGIWIRDNAEEVATLIILSGSVDVRVENGIYDIRCELETLTGEQVNASYKGAIQFTPGFSEYEDFDTPQNICFEGAQGRYYGNWYYPFADDLSLNFYTGEFDEKGKQVQGYWLNVELYMPKDPSPMTANKVADGIYKVEERSNIYSKTNLPYTFIKGYEFDFWGTIYQSGTYITYIEKSGIRKFAFIERGTITVSEEGSKFVFDLIAENGIAITGTCSGMALRNYCDNNVSEPKRPYSTLEQDYTMEFGPTIVCEAFNMGDYIVPDRNVFVVRVADPDYSTGDYLSLEIMTEGDRLTDGTYVVNNSLENKTVLIGQAASDGQPLFSWFADLDSTDDEGYQNTMAPINSGSFTITVSESVTTFSFDFVDDNGHKITGSWTGTITYPEGGDTKMPQKTKLKTFSDIKPAEAPMPAVEKM